MLPHIPNYFTAGALKQGGSWGGDECRAAVSLRVRVMETCFWMLVGAVSFYYFHIYANLAKISNDLKKRLSQSSQGYNSGLIRSIEKVVGTILLLMWFQVWYYKINKKSLINLLQPCHILLFLQSIALLSNYTLSSLIACHSLPLITGASLAILFPDTSGLDQPFERTSFFIQHYIILTMPIYLLVRNGYAGLSISSFRTVCLSSWIVLVCHWPGYEVRDETLLYSPLTT